MSELKRSRLGVNIDHVATLRQARGEMYPSLSLAADLSLRAGADQITIHLREDRRHIQDTDLESVALVTRKYGKPLNLEMGCNEGILEIAIAAAPDWVCLVPENRQERTTEGGLDLITAGNFEKIKTTCEKLKKSLPNVKISLFLEADVATLQKATLLKPDAVEIHTGEYAHVFSHGDDTSKFIEKFTNASHFLQKNGIACHAGHGLTDDSLIPLVEEGIFAEFNIGHWIISQSIFDGIDKVVSKMVAICNGKF